MKHDEPLATKALFEGWWQAAAETIHQKEQLFHSRNLWEHV